MKIPPTRRPRSRAGLQVRWGVVAAYALVLLLLPAVLVAVVQHRPAPPAPVAAAVTLPAVRPQAAPAARRPGPCPRPSGTALRTAPTTAARTVALTFDDGPGRETRAVLDVLAREHVHATFFMIGDQLAARRDTARLVVAQGHTVGNHSETHPEVPASVGWDPRRLDRELSTSQHRFATEVGVRPCLFRPPDGVLRGAAGVARRHGLTLALWSVDPRDWDDHRTASIERGAEAGLTQAHPVVLLHDGGSGGPGTVAALPRVIERYRAAGYAFVTLDGRT